MFQRTFLTGLAVTLLVVQACGSDDGRKRTRQDSDAGQGGEAGAGVGPDSGGSEGTSGGMPAVTGGEGGTLPVAMGGEGGQPTPVAMGGEAGAPPVVAEGGAGGAGEPPLPPDPEVLFTVEAGAAGLPDTAISAQQNPQNVIYSSKTGSQDPFDGDNTVKVIGADLGLAPTDSIIAFTELQPEPQDPVYAFSVTEGTEGASPTAVNDAYWNSDYGASHVYFSSGEQSYRELGEGGDQYGYNGLLLRGPSLGNAGWPDGGEGLPDNLRGLMFHDANLPLTDLYFTTGGGATGLAGGAIEATPADQRGCTVFKSALDGTASVAFTCAELGLVAGDQIDGLLVYGDDAASEVIFSVTASSVGATGSAVDTVVTAADPYADSGATLFRSVGDDTNTLHLTTRDLGFGYQYDDDELDALAVMNGRAGSVAHAATCTFTYDPYGQAEGGLSSIDGVSHVGGSVLLIAGTILNAARVLAFDANTCAYLDQQDLPTGFERADWAIVPLQGWSAATPLDNVEYLSPQYNGTTGRYDISRHDAAGVLQNTATTDIYYEPWSLVYEPLNQLVYAVTRNTSWYPSFIELAVMDRPTAATTTLSAEFHWLSLPCSYNARVTGVDQDGNLFLAQRQGGGGYRVCGYKPHGALLPLPYVWEPTADENLGFVLGRGAHYSLSTNNGSGPFQIERGSYAP